MPSQCSWCGATASCSCYRMQAYFLHKLASEEGLFVSWNSSLASLLPIHLCSSRFIASSAMLTRCFCDDDDNKYFSLYMTLLKGRNYYVWLVYPKIWFSDFCVTMHLFCSIRPNLGIYEKCTQFEPIMRNEHNSSTEQCCVDTLFYAMNHSS